MAKYQCHQVQHKLELISLDSKLVLKILTELAQEHRYNSMGFIVFSNISICISIGSKSDLAFFNSL